MTGFARELVVEQRHKKTRKWPRNANNAPTPKNKRGADYQEQIKIGNIKRCKSTE